MFIVEGYINGVSYAVSVDDPRRDPNVEGIAVGTGRAMRLLADHEGEEAMVTPVGPFYEVTKESPEGILACLLEHTRGVRITGDAPQLVPDPVPGVVY